MIRRLILIGWLLTLGAAGYAALSLPGHLSGGGWYVPGSQSLAALNLTSHGFAGRGDSDAVIVAQGPFALSVLHRVEADPALHVTSAAPPVARGDVAAASVGLGMSDGTARRVLPGVQSSLRYPGVRVAVVGAAAFFGEVNTLSAHDLVLAELATLPVLALILLFLYRSVVAALVSFVVGGTAIVWAFGALSVLARHWQISVFGENAASMLGLGVSVDYSLFIISRYRRERSSLSDQAALRVALRTSGHTVLFSGLIVICAMCCLFVIDLDVIQSIALAIVLAVGFAVISALVVLPAALLVLGDRIDALPLWLSTGRHARGRSVDWAWLARGVMGRPVLSLLACAALLGGLSLSALNLHTFTPDVRILPPSSAARWGYTVLDDEFGAGAASPLIAVVPAAFAGSLGVSARALPDVLDVSVTPGSSGHSMVQIVADGSASSAGSIALLARVRALVAPYRGVVGGETAEGVDANAAISSRLPLVAGLMLAVIYLLLMVTFRSVVLPLKAIAVNCLSVSATYGVLVYLFGTLQNFVPALLLAVLFSLSTDYEVFLLNRVREVLSGDTTSAVAVGLADTAPLITGAAALMVAVFAGFGAISLMPMRQLGVGLAIAVALDATVVRLVLVPACMRLAGRWNWWFPGERSRSRARGGVLRGHRRPPASLFPARHL